MRLVAYKPQLSTAVDMVHDILVRLVRFRGMTVVASYLPSHRLLVNPLHHPDLRRTCTVARPRTHPSWRASQHHHFRHIHQPAPDHLRLPETPPPSWSSLLSSRMPCPPGPLSPLRSRHLWHLHRARRLGPAGRPYVTRLTRLSNGAGVDMRTLTLALRKR
jgi:hypothetical protein